MRSVSVPSEGSISEAIKIAEIAGDGKMKEEIDKLKEASQEYIKARDEYALEVQKVEKLKQEIASEERVSQEALKLAELAKVEAEAAKKDFENKKAALEIEYSNKLGELSSSKKLHDEARASLENEKYQAEKIKSELESAKLSFESEKASIYAKVEKTFSIWGSK